MNIQFRLGSEEVTEKLKNSAQLKLGKLSRIIDERNFEAQAHIDIERESGSHKSESMWRASINLDVGGDRFNASERGSTPEKATDLAIKELKYEVRKAQTKQISLARRGGSLLKRLTQSFT